MQRHRLPGVNRHTPTVLRDEERSPKDGGIGAQREDARRERIVRMKGGVPVGRARKGAGGVRVCV